MDISQLRVVTVKDFQYWNHLLPRGTVGYIDEIRRRRGDYNHKEVLVRFNLDKWEGCYIFSMEDVELFPVVESDVQLNTTHHESEDN